MRSILSWHHTDCKGAAALLQSALANIGVKSDIVLVNFGGMLPPSFIVPTGDWANHVIVYIPSIDKYVDITIAAEKNIPWQHSADRYKNFISLNTSDGLFHVIN